MKNTKRALRRHHRQRMIQRAMRSLVLSNSMFQSFSKSERYQRSVRWYNNMAKCNCWMCRNPRWRDGLTTQERRLQEAARYELAQTLPEAERGLGKGLSNRPAA